MDLRQIQYFVALYEERSVTKAAKRLNIVQPALSMQISKLETDFGQRLFIRGSRGMTPTPAAEQMYQLYLPILADFYHAKEQLTHQYGATPSHLRVGLVPSVPKTALAQSVVAFKKQYPSVMLTLQDGATDSLAQSVQSGLFDLAIGYDPKPFGQGKAIQSLSSQTLTTQTLIADNIMLAVGEHHHRLPPVVPAALLTTLTWVLPTPSHELRQLIDQWVWTLGIRLKPAIEVDDIRVSLDLVAQGPFATLLPRRATHQKTDQSALTWHTVSGSQVAPRLVCITSTHRPVQKTAKAFVESLKNSLMDLSDR